MKLGGIDLARAKLDAGLGWRQIPGGVVMGSPETP